MPETTFPHALPLAELRPHLGPIALALLVLAALHVGFTILEQVSIIRMDAWIPLQSMEEAEWYTLIISSAAQAIRIGLVGCAVWFVARPLRRAASAAVSARRFLGFWFAVSLAIGAATLALDGVGYWLQFSGMAMDGTTFRWSFLGLIYAKLFAYAVLVSLLFSAGTFAAPTLARPAAGLRGLLLGFFLFLLVWLSIDGVLVPLVSYLPFVSPFWFVPNEDEPSRFFVGQGSRLAAEAIAFVLYALLWIRLFGRSLLPSTPGAASASP